MGNIMRGEEILMFVLKGIVERERIKGRKSLIVVDDIKKGGCERVWNGSYW